MSIDDKVRSWTTYLGNKLDNYAVGKVDPISEKYFFKGLEILKNKKEPWANGVIRYISHVYVAIDNTYDHYSK